MLRRSLVLVAGLLPGCLPGVEDWQDVASMPAACIQAWGTSAQDVFFACPGPRDPTVVPGPSVYRWDGSTVSVARFTVPVECQDAAEPMDMIPLAYSAHVSGTGPSDMWFYSGRTETEHEAVHYDGFSQAYAHSRTVCFGDTDLVSAGSQEAWELGPHCALHFVARPTVDRTLLCPRMGSGGVTEPLDPEEVDFGGTRVRGWASGRDDVYALTDLALYHFDGRAWSTLADVAGGVAIHGSGPKDVWVVQTNQLLHWDGGTWKAHGDLHWSQMKVVWSNAPDDVWAGGVDGVLMHYDGSTWTASNTPRDLLLAAVAGVPAAYQGRPEITALFSTGKEEVWVATQDGKLRRRRNAPTDVPSCHRCGDTCADLQRDPDNCGACGNACNTVESAVGACVAGSCQIRCGPGTLDCDGNRSNGCEVQLDTNPSHCGGCGRVCPGGSCALGNCASTVVVEDATNIRQLVVAEDSLFWANSHFNGVSPDSVDVYLAQRDGSGANRIFSFVAANARSADIWPPMVPVGSGVYVATPAGIVRLDAATPDTPVVVVPLQAMPAAMAVQDGALFWQDNAGVWSAPLSGAPATPTVVAATEAERAVTAWDVDAGVLYVVRQAGTASRWELVRYSLASPGAAVTVAKGPDWSSVSFLDVRGQWLWLQPQSSRMVFHWDLETLAGRVLTEDFVVVGGGPEHLYGVGSSDLREDPALYSLALADGSLRRLLDLPQSNGIADDGVRLARSAGDAVYVMTRGVGGLPGIPAVPPRILALVP